MALISDFQETRIKCICMLIEFDGLTTSTNTLEFYEWRLNSWSIGVVVRVLRMIRRRAEIKTVTPPTFFAEFFPFEIFSIEIVSAL